MAFTVITMMVNNATLLHDPTLMRNEDRGGKKTGDSGTYTYARLALDFPNNSQNSQNGEEKSVTSIVVNCCISGPTAVRFCDPAAGAHKGDIVSFTGKVYFRDKSYIDKDGNNRQEKEMNAQVYGGTLYWQPRPARNKQEVQQNNYSAPAPAPAPVPAPAPAPAGYSQAPGAYQPPAYPGYPPVAAPGGYQQPAYYQPPASVPPAVDTATKPPQSAGDEFMLNAAEAGIMSSLPF